MQEKNIPEKVNEATHFGFKLETLNLVWHVIGFRLNSNSDFVDKLSL